METKQIGLITGFRRKVVPLASAVFDNGREGVELMACLTLERDPEFLVMLKEPKGWRDYLCADPADMASLVGRIKEMRVTAKTKGHKDFTTSLADLVRQGQRHSRSTVTAIRAKVGGNRQ